MESLGIIHSLEDETCCFFSLSRPWRSPMEKHE